MQLDPNGVGQIRVVVHGDIGRVIRRPTGTGSGEKAVPSRFAPLGGEKTIHPLTNELRESPRPTRRERLETLVLVGTELNPDANHDGTLARTSVHGGIDGTR